MLLGLEQAGVSEEAPADFGMALHPANRLGKGLTQPAEILDGRIGQGGLIEMSPQCFDRIERADIGRRPLHLGPPPVLAQGLAGRAASVRREAIPQEEDRAPPVMLQGLEEAHNLGAGHRSPMEGQRSPQALDFGIGQHRPDPRQALPAADWFLEEGGLAAWCPGRPHRRTLGEAAFVEKPQPGFQAPGVFLIRTWAPKGHTPYLYHFSGCDRLSTLTALAVSPRNRRLALYLHCQARNLTGLRLRAFLRHLLRHLRGPVVLLWDGRPIHLRTAVRGFLARHPRLRVHTFPAYALELNPTEYVWRQADRGLANGAPDDVATLYRSLRQAVRRIRSSQKLLWSSVPASDFPGDC